MTRPPLIHALARISHTLVARLLLPAAPAILFLWLEPIDERNLYWLFAILIVPAYIYSLVEFSLQIH